MSEAVWVSNAMNDSRLDSDITTDLNEKNIDLVIDSLRRNESGEVLEAQLFPTAIYPGKALKTPFRRLPHLFKAGGYWVVSEPVADVLRQFDLGGGGLYPVKIFQKDRKTRVEGEYFCLNFGNVKHAFLPDESSDRIAKDENPLRYYLPLGTWGHDIVAVASDAMAGADVWIDPLLRHAFFVSDRLRSALKCAKIEDAFRLKKCSIIAAISSKSRDV
jgi:hypothetical protein